MSLKYYLLSIEQWLQLRNQIFVNAYFTVMYWIENMLLTFK